jgi:hypothetical protein
MVTGAWLPTVAGGAWPWLAQATARHDTLAVIDSTLAYGPAFADYIAHLKLPAFETGDDMGALWYTTLAPRLGQTPAHEPVSLIGLARASDYFVLEALATGVGRMAAHRYETGAGAIAQVAFVLTPCRIR